MNMVCLERRNEMPAALEEIEEAEEEGIIIHPGFGPKRSHRQRRQSYSSRNCSRTKWVFDQNKRFNPAFYENSESQIECDTIIMAIGQAPRSGLLHARRQGGHFAARTDCGQSADAYDIGSWNFCRRRLRVWSAPDH